MRLGHLTHDREPEPGAGQPAGRACAVKAVEDVREILVLDAGPVVAHSHLAVADCNFDLASGRAPLGRVVQ
jgi:hypothetical protein